MTRVAILRCARLPSFVTWDVPNLEELFEEDKLLQHGFDDQGVEAEPVIWNQPNVEEIAAPTPVGCFPQSVFTAEDMSARVDCHPDDYKMEINDETVVLFAFPDPLLDWVGPILVIHVPSVSEVVLDQEGKILFDDYKSVDGQKAIAGVLNDEELITRILERAKDIERCEGQRHEQLAIVFVSKA
jgi:hypothetical protein